MDMEMAGLLSTPERFSRWALAGCAQQQRTLGHLSTCVTARLHDGRRKTHQPSGSRLAADPAEADALRQRINRAYLQDWPDGVVRQRLWQVLEQSIVSPLAWTIDDTGIVKKGKKSPGVHRQYTGTAGKTENCQVIVSTHLAGHEASGPLEMDLYLPKAWCDDKVRRKEAGIPDDVGFKTKPELALSQIDRLLAGGMPRRTVLADAGYGDSTAFREALDAREVEFIVALTGTQHLWRPGEGPDPPRRLVSARRGRPQSRWLPRTHKSVAVSTLVRELPPESWKMIDLRPETPGKRISRFAFIRDVRGAYRASRGRLPGPPRTLIAEWRADDEKPSHYFLSSVTEAIPESELARLAKLRWRVERDYQDLKQEVGFTHYEGRRWTGLKHHLTICMAAITYLVGLQALSPPHNTPVFGSDPTCSTGHTDRDPGILHPL